MSMNYIQEQSYNWGQNFYYKHLDIATSTINKDDLENKNQKIELYSMQYCWKFL